MLEGLGCIDFHKVLSEVVKLRRMFPCACAASGSSDVDSGTVAQASPSVSKRLGPRNRQNRVHCPVVMKYFQVDPDCPL